MSNVGATNSVQQVTVMHGTTGRTGSAESLNKNDFLNLMMDELSNQDPLSASSSDPSQYLSQLAQFTSLEQQTNTAQSTATSAGEQQAGTALSLLGHTVSYIDPNSGATVTGSVTQVNFSSSGPTVTVGGVSGISPASVTEVQ
jgi:flagellar basal-body rod modification protein FlgD